MAEFQKTEKQMAVMNLLFEAMDKGEMLTPKQIHAKLTYGPDVSYPAIICTIRILRDTHGLIESVYGKDKRNGKFKPGRTSFLKPTIKAYRMFRFPKPPMPWES